jgi:serine/threonine-protein kinase
VTVAAAPAARPPSSSTPEEGRFASGTVLAQRYRISGKLGEGGMGEVYKATDLLLRQTVALKFLPERLVANSAAAERFRNEVRLARQVSHPNVCRVYDMGEAEGEIFLTMEYVDGEDLASLLGRIGRLPADKATEIARRLCAGLAAAHEKGVLHRDFKPANIMIDGRGQARITDFGLALLAGSAAGEKARGGTPGYMAPEQIDGQAASERSDIYALGLVLFEMFAGKRPFEASDLAAIHAKQKQGAPSIGTSVRDLDPAVDRVIARCLDPEPLKRPKSALAVAAALPGGDPLAAALEAGETPSPEMVAAAGGKDATKPWLAVTCLAALAAGLVMLTWGQERLYLNTAVPSDMGPEALAQRARDILAGLGYPKPTAQDWNFDNDFPRVMTLARRDRKSLRARVAEARPPLIYFWYRSAPQRLAPWHSSTKVSEVDPPQVAAGSVTMRLDTEGRLSFLDAIPPETAADKRAASSVSDGFEWKRLFDAAGLDSARFSPATPRKTPPMAIDAQAAWIDNREAKPRSEPLRVEAAAWRGRAVWFTLSGETDSGSAPQQGDNAVWPAVLTVAAVLAAAWGWRNVRAGRADVRGAASLAILICACGLVGDLLQARHGFDAAEFHGLFRSLADDVFGGIMIGAMYLALEPYVRRRWPQALIGWTRLWSGGWRDPLVGRHILVGLAAGSCFFSLLEWVPSGGGFSLAPLDYAVRPSVVAAQLVSGISLPIFMGCLTLMVIATLSRILRNRWLSALLISMLMVYAFGQGSGWRSAVFFFVMYFAFSALLLRLGLLAAISALWIMFPSYPPLTLDTSAWYFYATPVTWAAVLAVGAWAFFTALAGQKLLAEEE